MGSIAHHIITGTPRANRWALLGIIWMALHACWRIWQETRPDIVDRIQIMLPDPMVAIYLDSFIPIVLIAISLLALKRVHLPLALGFVLIAPGVRELLRFVDEIPGMGQPSPMILVITLPLLILTASTLLRPRYRSLDALAVLFGYWTILILYMLYHLAFIFPAYQLTNAQRTLAAAELITLEPGALAGRMTQIGAKEVTALGAAEIAYLNDMSDMNIDHTFPGESAQRILTEAPVIAHSWEVVGRTFVDRRVILYDGRLQREGQAPRLWALPASFAQEHLTLVAAGFYLTITIVAYFWTIMALFICHIHGARVDRIRPMSKRKIAPSAPAAM